MWKGMVPRHHQGMGPAVGSRGGCQVCRALGVLSTLPWYGLGPPGHPSGHPPPLAPFWHPPALHPGKDMGLFLCVP